MSIDTGSIVAKAERRRGASGRATVADREEPLVIGPEFAVAEVLSTTSRG